MRKNFNQLRMRGFSIVEVVISMVLLMLVITIANRVIVAGVVEINLSKKQIANFIQ